MEKVHALDGYSYAASKMSLLGVEEYLQKAGLVVRVYKDVCQTVIIAKKHPALSDRPVFTTVKGAAK